MVRVTFPAGVVLSVLLALAVTAAKAADARPTASKLGAQTEIQINLCAPRDEIERALNLHRRGAPLQVWMFDDTALTLFERGLRFRLRVERGASELTLKVANQDCAQLAPKLVPPGEGKCEYDMHGTTSAGAVSLNRSLSATATRKLVAGRLQLANALSPAQIRYLGDVKAWPLPAGIQPLGPQRAVSYGAPGKPYVVEVLRIPTGETFVEISRKVPTADATRVRSALVDELTRAGVEMCSDQSAQSLNKLRAQQR